MTTVLNILAPMKELHKTLNENYKIYMINQQYQSFSTSILLPLDEYLEKIRPGLIYLMIKNHEVELNASLVFFLSKANPNNDCNIFITSKSANIDEALDLLIKKHEDLKDINFLLKGVESITYSFTKIIVKNTFVESPDWIRNKNVQPIHQTKTISVFRFCHNFFIPQN